MAAIPAMEAGFKGTIPGEAIANEGCRKTAGKGGCRDHERDGGRESYTHLNRRFRGFNAKHLLGCGCRTMNS